MWTIFHSPPVSLLHRPRLLLWLWTIFHSPPLSLLHPPPLLLWFWTIFHSPLSLLHPPRLLPQQPILPPSMDALSTPVSSIRPGAFVSNNPRDSHLFKPSSNTTLPSYHILSARPTKPSSISHPFAPKPFVLRSQSPQLSPPFLQPTTKVHRRASIGYAAFLLDTALGSNCIEAVDRDVRRFVRGAHGVIIDPLMKEGMKGEVLRGVAEGGGFCRHVVALVRMLVEKGKAGLVGEVMEEFAKLYDELTGTRTLVVSSERRMEGEEIAAIARRVQRSSGAATVRVWHRISM